MKKLLMILALGSFVACNSGSETETTTDSTTISADTTGMGTMSTDTMAPMTTDTTGMGTVNADTTTIQK